MSEVSITYVLSKHSCDIYRYRIHTSIQPDISCVYFSLICSWISTYGKSMLIVLFACFFLNANMPRTNLVISKELSIIPCYCWHILGVTLPFSASTICMCLLQVNTSLWFYDIILYLRNSLSIQWTTKTNRHNHC